MNILAMVLLLNSGAFANSPPIVDIPQEDFSYSCKINYSQSNVPGGCYANFVAETSFGKTHSMPFLSGNMGTVRAKDLKFTLEYKNSDSSCAPNPVPLISDNTFLSVEAFRQIGDGANQGQYVAGLYLRVAEPGKADRTKQAHPFGDSKTHSLFSAGYLESMTSVDNARVTYTLSAECTKK